MEVILKDTVTHFSINPSSNKSMIIIHILSTDGLLFIELLHIQPSPHLSVLLVLLLLCSVSHTSTAPPPTTTTTTLYFPFKMVKAENKC